jgi:lysozyme
LDNQPEEVIDEYSKVLESFEQKEQPEKEVIKAIPVARVPFPSSSFIRFLKDKEGFFPNRYKCPANVPTIGYGFTKDGIEDAQRMGFLPEGYEFPMTMTKQEAEEFLCNIMIPTYEKMVNKNVHVPLTIPQKSALVSFSFNLGESNLRNLASQLNKNDYNITNRMLKYCYAKKKKLKGLATRREQEVKLWKNI